MMPWRRWEPWPLAAKVPVLVGVLMAFAATLMSSGVLIGLKQEQDGRIGALSNAYLDATASSLAPALARRDVWEAFDILDRSRASFGALRLRLAAAISPDGQVLAATDARRLPVGSRIEPATNGEPNLVWASRDVVEFGVGLGRVLIEIDVSEQQAQRTRLGLLLVAANIALAAFLALLGWWLVHRMLRPVRLLTRYLGHGVAAEPAEIAPGAFAHEGREFSALFQSYNAMARAAGEREALRARLAEEARLATLGTLAGSMAHEVNNPLGGMMTALDTMAAHGTDVRVREQAIGFLRRGLEDIRNVVRASLVLYKVRAGPAVLGRDGLDDLRYLVGPEAARRAVHLTWDNRIDQARVGNATAVRQAALNLLLNAVAASPPQATVSLAAWQDHGRLILVVADEGPGLPQGMEAMLTATELMPPNGSPGLGLWTAICTARSLGGTIRREVAALGTTLVLDIPTESAHAVG